MPDAPATLISEATPRWDHREIHQRWIAASPAAVCQALYQVTMADAALTRALMRIRHLGRAARPAADPGEVLLLDWAAPRKLAERTGTEVVAGLASQFWRLRGGSPRYPDSIAAFAAFAKPGYAKVATDVRLTPARGGVLLSTETRILATDGAPAAGSPSTRRSSGPAAG